MADNTNDADEPETVHNPDPKPSRWPAILIGLATVVAILSALTVWGRTQALDTDEWVGLSTELLEQEEVQQAVSNYLVNVLYEEGDVTAGLEERFPDDFKGFAGPLAGALRGPLTDGVERLLSSDAFQDTWEATNREAHETMVAILRDETREGISTADGVVALELRPLVINVGESFGISGDRLEGIPEDAGRIVIFESDELDTVQQAVKVLDFLTWFLIVLLVALYALAVYLARGRRMRVLRNVGWSLTAVGIILLVARTLAVRALVDAIVNEPSNRATADTVATVATGLLRQVGWSALIYGLLIVAFTALMGDHRWAVAARRMLAPALNASTGAVIGGTVILLLLLAWWSPGRAFEGWTTALILVGLVVGAIAALRARTQREF
ncbi:MAG: hypothetical protein ACR2QE_14990, partial [Acidimicrobiales bacterium]